MRFLGIRKLYSEKTECHGILAENHAVVACLVLENTDQKKSNSLTEIKPGHSGSECDNIFSCYLNILSQSTFN